MKKIGFDVDRVLTDLGKFQIEMVEDFFLKKYEKRIVNFQGTTIREIFSCTEEEENEFWKANVFNYLIKHHIRPGAKEIINKLMLDEWQVYFISSRIKINEQSILGYLMKKILRNWFIKNSIDIDNKNFHFCSLENSGEEKVKYCLENNIEYMVEDEIEDIERLKNITNVIIFDSDYNKNLTNVTRIDSFYALYNLISANYNKDKFKFLSKSEQLKLSREELIKYYKELKRYYSYSKTFIDLNATKKFYIAMYPFLKKIFDYKYPYFCCFDHEIPSSNGIIFVANHRDIIDPPLIMSLIGARPVHLLLKSEFLDTKYSSFLKKIGCIFVERGNKDSEIAVSEEMTRILLKKENIIIFPEGTRNKTEKILLDFKTGAVSIAQKTGAPIIPIAITKKFDDVKEKIVIKVGDPITVGYFDDIIDKNNELKLKIENMILECQNNKVKIK